MFLYVYRVYPEFQEKFYIKILPALLVSQCDAHCNVGVMPTFNESQWQST